MTHWTDGPIAGFDTETTGTDVEKDRIVTACVGASRPPTMWMPGNWLINPGVEIPEGATRVHGITTQHAKDAGKTPIVAIGQIAWALENAWSHGIPVVVYNAVFDLTILDRELRRHLGRPLEVSGPVIDPLVLDKAVDTYRRGSRRLTDVCAHYGVTLTEEDAHSAEGDVRAAMRLAWKLGRSGLLPEVMNPTALHAFQVEVYRQQRLSFNAYRQKQGKPVDDDNLVWPMKPYNGEPS